MPFPLRPALAATLALLLLLSVPVRAELPPYGPPGGDATAIEYGLIAALVAVVIITGLTTLGTNLDSQFHTVATEVAPASPGGGDPNDPGAAVGTTSASACGALEGGEFSQVDAHAPGGTTHSEASTEGLFQDGGFAKIKTEASSDFGTQTFAFEEYALVLNASCAARANVKLIHELDWTLTLLAADPPAGTSEMALLRMDFDLAQLAWGIGGPVPEQDGRFEIIGPGGSSWGWSMEKNVVTDKLEITSSNGPALDEFLFDAQGVVTIQGIDFEPQEVLNGIAATASFEFEIPYGVPTDVTFKIRRSSHTLVAAAPMPALPLAAPLLLALALLCAAWVRSRVRAPSVSPR